MAKNHQKSFDRVFSSKDLFKGTARRSLIWSSLASIALCFLLFDFFLIADLLSTRGSIDLSGNEVAEAVELEQSALGTSGEAPETELFHRENSGVFPSVWWSRNKYWGPLVAGMFRNVPLTNSNSNALIVLVILAVGIGFLRSVAMSRANHLSGLVSADAATRLRRSLHKQALRLGPGDVQNKDASQILTLFTDETDRLRVGVATYVQHLGRYPFEIFLMLIVALSIHHWVAIQCLFPLGFCWYLLHREQKNNELSQLRAEARTDAELRLLAESFRKTRIVRGYGMEKFEHQQFQKHLSRFQEKLVSARQGGTWSYLVCRVFVMVCIAIVLYLVGNKVSRAPEELSLASALILLVALARLYQPFEILAKLQSDLENPSLAADRIFRYLNRVSDVSQAVGAKFLQPLSKGIQFESVTFQLPNRKKLLNRLNLKLPAGSVVAIIGLEPLEAQCLAYLLPRFAEPTAGRILFDGEDISWVTLESLRAETIYVGGTDPFFTGTVLENISCGNQDYSLQKVTEAAKASHAHSFVLKLPQGYETVIGEHGEQLDPGQGFRLSLARAILRNPALMIIEEPHSRLDEDTKSFLDDAYNRICQDRTVIFLPSRLSTLRRADQIVVLHDGQVAASGKYSDLVKKSQLYRHWEYVRFNEFRHTTEDDTAK